MPSSVTDLTGCIQNAEGVDVEVPVDDAKPNNSLASREAAGAGAGADTTTRTIRQTVIA